MKFKIFVSLVSLLLLGTFSFLQARTWTIQGQPEEGEFIGYIPEEQVEILLNNSPVAIPLSEFSKEDLVFLVSQFSRESCFPAEPSPTPKNSLFLVGTILFLSLVGFSILCWLWQAIQFRKTMRVKHTPQDSKPTNIPVPENLSFLGPILAGLRFNESSELASEAQKEAEKQTNRFLATASDKYPSLLNPGSKCIPPQAGLQLIADDLNPEFTRNICAPNSFWMKKIYGENATIPSDLAAMVNNLLLPIQVPVGKEILLQPSVLGVAVVAAVGAIVGAGALSFFTTVTGMKTPSDSSVLVGATLGSFLLSALLFRISANERLRADLQNALFILGLADTIITFVVWIKSHKLFLSKKSKLQFPWLKRVELYLAMFFLLRLMKREPAFNLEEYRNKLIALYKERIQAIVMLLALYNAQQNRLIREQDRLTGEIGRLNARLRGKEELDHSMASVIPLIKSFWTSDVHELAPIIKSLVQEFDLLGFELPSMPIPWLAQVTRTSAISSASRATKPRIFRWSEEKRTEFVVLGDPDEGDEVEVLREPVYQNGEVFEKGHVQEYSNH